MVVVEITEDGEGLLWRSRVVTSEVGVLRSKKKGVLNCMPHHSIFYVISHFLITQISQKLFLFNGITKNAPISIKWVLDLPLEELNGY